MVDQHFDWTDAWADHPNYVLSAKSEKKSNFPNTMAAVKFVSM